MMVIRERWKWWLLSVSVLAILLSWGKNLELFSDLFFYYFPGYNKFRTVSMSLVILQFTFPFMGFMLLSKITKGEYDKDYLIKKIKLSLYITGGLCLLFAMAGSVFFTFKSDNDWQIQKEIIDAVIADRKVLLRMDGLRSLVIIIAGAGLIWAFLKAKINRNIFIGTVALLIFIDLFTVGKRYLNEGDFISKSEYNRNFEPTPIDELILKETSKDYRVLNLTHDPFSDSRTSYFHKSLGGYHAAKLRRYQEIIDHQLTKSDSANKSPFPFNKSVVDMLNTKYIIYTAGDKEQVFPNTSALDNAWFVKNIQLVDNADAEMEALNTFDPAATMIVDKRFASQVNGFEAGVDSSASITLQSYAPNDLIYKTKSSVEQIAAFAEIYYQPGWDAFIDGKKTEHFRCNYILRAMRIPAGEHTIEFKFKPVSYYTGETIAMASSGMILLLLLGVAGMSFRKRRKEEELKLKNATTVSGTSLLP
ncbi:MAG: YfhO family protein [Chitinophagales bacterium]|nr:YfhO family protein [Chitinophagales bacterium]